MHSKFRTAIRKLVWMSQLRDDIKYPVKELSRSLVNPQGVDFDNLIHLLKHVNQTRDYVYVMEPQSGKSTKPKMDFKGPYFALLRCFVSQGFKKELRHSFLRKTGCTRLKTFTECSNFCLGWARGYSMLINSQIEVDNKCPRSVL